MDGAAEPFAQEDAGFLPAALYRPNRRSKTKRRFILRHSLIPEQIKNGARLVGQVFDPLMQLGPRNRQALRLRVDVRELLGHKIGGQFGRGHVISAQPIPAEVVTAQIDELTPDLGGTATTVALGAAIRAALPE